MDKGETNSNDAKNEVDDTVKEVVSEDNKMVELRENTTPVNSTFLEATNKLHAIGNDKPTEPRKSDEEKENESNVINSQKDTDNVINHDDVCVKVKNEVKDTIVPKTHEFDIARKHPYDFPDDDNDSNGSIENKPNFNRSCNRSNKDKDPMVNKLTEKNLRMFNKMQAFSLTQGFDDVHYSGLDYSRHKEQRSKSRSPMENGNRESVEEKNGTMNHSTCTKNPLLLKSLMDSNEDLMQFAEILYKCTLCTSIPSILTSKSNFIKHVTENHLTVDDQFKVCKICCLKFRTEEDVRRHVLCIHAGSDRLSPMATGSDIIKSEVCNHGDNESDSDSSGHRSYKTKTTKRSKPHVPDFENPKQLVDHAGIETLNGSLDLSKKDSKPERNTTECNSSQNYSQENSSNVKTEKSTFNVQQITDQIIKSNLHGRNISPPTNQRLPFIPSFTPEFGKYTKLVREGGNIVYFCQVCNWMTPVKAHFQAHCGSLTHSNKVKQTIEQEKGEKVDVNNKDSNTDRKSPPSIGGFDMKYAPSSHPSILNIPNTSHFTKIQEVSMFYSYMRPRSLSHCGRTPVVTGQGFQDRAEILFNKSLDNGGHLGSLHRKRKRVPASKMASHTASHQSNSDSDSNEETNTKENQPKCSKTSMSLLRNKLLHGQNESSVNQTEHSSEGDHLNESAHRIESHVNMSDKTAKDNDQFSQNSPYKRSKHDDSAINDNGIYQVSANLDNSQGNTEARLGDSDKGVSKLYRCVSCPFEYSNLEQYEEHFSKVHFGSMQSDGPSNTALHRLLSGMGGGQFSQGQSEGQGHSGKCGDLAGGAGSSVEMGENWRVQKLKEILPDFLEVNEKGNTSRDYLLQCVSMSACLPDAPLWSSACNKAVREIFPNSLAQRKGKYKNYYFGLSMAEMFHGQEDNINPLDADGQIYQPIRDINADIEKLMEQLPGIIHWNGCMDEGIYRADILTLLSDILEEPDILNWGTQCNRAIKLVFPMLDMKRKGKFKTTKYFGVSFNQNIGPITGKQSSSELPISRRMELDKTDEQDEPREKTYTRLETKGGHPSVLEDQASGQPGQLVPVFPQWFKVEAESQMEQYLTKFGGVFENSRTRTDIRTEDEENYGDDEREIVEDDKTHS